MARTNWVDNDAVAGKVDAAAMNALGREINALKRRVFYIDEYGADPTGVNDSNQALIDAYAAMGTSPGVIVFGVGSYKLFVGLNQAAGRLLRPRQAVVGQGSALTTIDYRGPGAFVETRNLNFGSDSTAAAGGVHDLRISGWNSGENNSYGIRYGDIWRMRITGVEIAGFNRPGCIGLWGDNQTHWSERAYIECMVDQCTENYVFESNTGAAGSGSFDYSTYKLSFIAQPEQHGFVLRSGTAGSVVSMNGVELTLTGNCQMSSPGDPPNTGEMFRVGKDNDDEAGLSGVVNIAVETSGNPAGMAHYDFMVGDGPWWEASAKVTATGAINLIPFSGADFQLGSASPRNFAFAGLLKGSPSLGSTSTVQAFQSLQLLSQARGGHFLTTTDEVQTIYIKQAAGGSFPLTFSGDTTVTPLAHDATPAQVQTALEGLPSIGVGNVRVSAGQARFVNTVQQDEHAYTVEFIGALSGTDVPLITADASSLTGTGHAIDVVVKAPGSAHETYIVYLQDGNIFLLEPEPGTYRLKYDIGGLTTMSGFGDSPFGVTTVDIWIKQPDTGGPAIFEPAWFAPRANAGSTARFAWMDGVDPVLSTTPGAFDIIRLTSYNFSTWIGQHITKPPDTGIDLSAVDQDVVPDAGWTRSLGTYSKPWGWGAFDEIRTRIVEFASSGKVATLFRNPAASVDQTLYLPDTTTDTLVGRESTDVLKHKDLTDASNTFPTFNQNTTGTAAGITGKTTPGGSLVGTTDVQTLTGKTYLSATASTATSGGTKTLLVNDAPVQIFTGSTTHTVKLPTTGVVLSQSWTFINLSSGAITVQSSAGNTILVMGSNQVATYTAMQADPTAAGHWYPLSAYPYTGNNTLVQRDSQGMAYALNFACSTASTATSGVTLTLAYGSAAVQIFTGSSNHTVKLPTGGVLPGMRWTVINNSTGTITVQSSAGNTITTVPSGEVKDFIAKIVSPTADTHWAVK